ncbi:hypothetical protein LGQ02_01400 [Bacillus shivajii]|uniref:hypothetical protein n=1 Tax=Bacillus shivajii TaxID=1983719 RepID=UPI001CFC18CE|nr:hypothetical protein [Bacillus shivajii]UCZ53485.1 hypothetical protein LGQ02_01400 [Bacillus shivajii]
MKQDEKKRPLSFINTILATILIAVVIYRFTVDESWEPFPNFFLFVIPTLFLLFGIEYVQEEMKVRKILGYVYLFIFFLGLIAIILRLTGVTT